MGGGRGEEAESQDAYILNTRACVRCFHCCFHCVLSDGIGFAFSIRIDADQATWRRRRRRSIEAPKALRSALVGSGTAVIVKEPELLEKKLMSNGPASVLNLTFEFVYWLVPKDPSVVKLLRLLLNTPRESVGGFVLAALRSKTVFLKTVGVKGFPMLRMPTVLPLFNGTMVAVRVLVPVLMVTTGEPAR